LMLMAESRTPPYFVEGGAWKEQFPRVTIVYHTRFS